jgi:hypothetical protein
MFAMQLNRRTSDAAIGTKYAAIAGLGFKQAMTSLAFVEPLTGVGGHLFGFAVTAYRTNQRGLQNHVIHWLSSLIVEG